MTELKTGLLRYARGRNDEQGKKSCFQARGLYAKF